MNRLTDCYNAISVLHQIPLGGEDLTCYAGSPRLVRAVGTEPFDTAAAGVQVIEHPDPGEVVWCDDAGVTGEALHATADDLTGRLARLGPDVRTARRLMAASPAAGAARRPTPGTPPPVTPSGVDGLGRAYG